MKLSRDRQREILEELAEVYPRFATDVVRPEFEEDDLTNIWYLREHELIEGSLNFSLSGAFIFQGAKITAKGIDFLADDGWIAAILGTVTVRLLADTVRELLLAKVEKSALTIPEKAKLRKHLETMSNEALKSVTKTLVEQGLQKIPDLIQLIQVAAQSVA